MIIAFLMIFVICFPLSTYTQGLNFILPQNETDAELQIEQGVFDPELWELIKPYYVQPIDISQGELEIVQELFPHFNEQLPTTSDLLSKYVPWGDVEISEFFQDYPQLETLRPILCFDTKNNHAKARCSFSISRQRPSTPFSQSMVLTINPIDVFTFDSRVKLTDNSVWWYRRNISCKPIDKLKIHIGNYGLSFDKGLFYGYFFPDRDVDNSKSDNWLYGSSKIWNGVKIDIGRPAYSNDGRVNFSAFMHKRKTEAAVGLITQFKLSNFAVLNSGISTMSLTRSEPVYYLHSGMSLNFRKFRTEIQTGVDAKAINSLPFSIESNWGEGQKYYSIKLITFPKGFNAPCSYFLKKVSFESDTVFKTTSLLSLQSRFRVSRYLTVSPSADMIYCGKQLENCAFKLTGVGSFNKVFFTVKYLGNAACNSNSSADNSLLNEFSFIINNRVSMKSNIDIKSWSSSKRTLEGSLSCNLDIFPALTFSPSFEVLQAHKNKTVARWAVQQTLRLWNQTFTEVNIEHIINKKDQKGMLCVDAKTSFLF